MKVGVSVAVGSVVGVTVELGSGVFVGVNVDRGVPIGSVTTVALGGGEAVGVAGVPLQEVSRAKISMNSNNFIFIV